MQHLCQAFGKLICLCCVCACLYLFVAFRRALDAQGTALATNTQTRTVTRSQCTPKNSHKIFICLFYSFRFSFSPQLRVRELPSPRLSHLVDLFRLISLCLGDLIVLCVSVCLFVSRVTLHKYCSVEHFHFSRFTFFSLPPRCCCCLFFSFFKIIHFTRCCACVRVSYMSVKICYLFQIVLRASVGIQTVHFIRCVCSCRRRH